MESWGLRSIDDQLIVTLLTFIRIVDVICVSLIRAATSLKNIADATGADSLAVEPTLQLS